VVQQNTASAEETASAAEELSSQADQLSELVTRFKLKQNRGNAFRPDNHHHEEYTYKESSWDRSSEPPRRCDHADKKGNGPQPRVPQTRQIERPKDVINLGDRDWGDV
jgi:methyl-accepting chemotaxis protein